jgi:Sulfotransferase family
MDPFGGECGAFDVFSDLVHIDRRLQQCYDPAIHGGLEALYKYHPNATILLTTRDPAHWLDSIVHWNALAMRISRSCKKPGYFDKWRDKNTSLDDMIEYYQYQADYVREFARRHPSLRFIDLKLEDTDNGRVMERQFGIPADCWGHANARDSPEVKAKFHQRVVQRQKKMKQRKDRDKQQSGGAENEDQ